MPKMDGYKFIEKLKQTAGYEKTPILVLSTLHDDESKQKAKAAGAIGWITKPFLPSQLIRSVTICLPK